MSSPVDLRQLAVRRDEPSGPPKTRRASHFGTRVVIPGVVLLGFLAVVGWAARDTILPARPVTVAPVITTQLEVQNEGAPLFLAAGWIEARPTPIMVTALTEGVVDKLLVVEGQKVKAKDEVATLIQDDAKLALQIAKADHELRKAELENAKAALKASQTNLMKPTHLKAALGEAQAMLAQKQTDLAATPFQLSGAKARLILAKQNFEYKKKASMSGALPESAFDQAKSELDNAAAIVDELESRLGKLKQEIEAQEQRRDALKERLDLKTDEIRQVAEAEANVRIANARLQQAEANVAVADLRLSRTVIRAPVDGQIMALIARPGLRLMGQAPIGHQESSTVVTMFNPGMLQVRADVRLGDVPVVQPGQLVKIDTPVTPDRPLDGEVLQVTSQADIQKNTLQVKVAIKSPPPTLRPDMLVQVTFLAPRPAKVLDADSQPLRILIPKQLVETVEGSTFVWVADIANRSAQKKPVKTGRSSGELVEVIQGLNPSDRLIVEGRQGLVDGQRIAITHADTEIESNRNEGKARPGRLPAAAEKKDHSGKH